MPVRFLHLRVTLLDCQPPVWRLLKVDESISLRDLHLAVERAMGWSEAWWWCFEQDEALLGEEAIAALSDDRPFVGDDDEPYVVLAPPEVPDRHADARVFAVHRLLEREGDACRYVRDDHDQWEFDVEVVAATTHEPTADDPFRFAKCVDGAGAAPPEDVGGVDGYLALQAILADEDDPDHAAWTEALPDFDPHEFDVALANAALAGFEAKPPRATTPVAPRAFKQRRRRSR